MTIKLGRGPRVDFRNVRLNAELQRRFATLSDQCSGKEVLSVVRRAAESRSTPLEDADLNPAEWELTEDFLSTLSAQDLNTLVLFKHHYSIDDIAWKLRLDRQAVTDSLVRIYSDLALLLRREDAPSPKCPRVRRSAPMKLILCALVLAAVTLFAYSRLALSDDHPVLTGQVIKVIDGDTIDVKLQSGPIRIRFQGIDAPEKTQAHGKEATAALSSLIMGKDVQIEPFHQDRYERLVGIVYLGELNVNAELIRSGHAWAMRRYMRKADAPLCSLEAEARIRQRGLWASSDAIAPWAYRKRTKASEQANRIPQTVESCFAAIGKPYS